MFRNPTTLPMVAASNWGILPAFDEAPLPQIGLERVDVPLQSLLEVARDVEAQAIESDQPSIRIHGERAPRNALPKPRGRLEAVLGRRPGPPSHRGDERRRPGA